MGKKLDLLFGRTSKQTTKLKSLLSLTVSRIGVLRNHRHVRCNQARGDVEQLLQLGQVDRALLRVEQVIKEQNMLDVFVMIEGYCHLLTERAVFLEHKKECPDELREAISSLIFAGSRCGDLPELQDIRSIIVSKFGKEFAAAAVELRNSCGVNPKMIQKLSTRQPDLESRQRVTKEIAAEKGIKLEFDEPSSVEENSSSNTSKILKQSVANPSVNVTHQTYTDVVSAAQAAFESAAYAASAARAAVELSQSMSHGKGSGDQSRGGGQAPSKENQKPKSVQADGLAGRKSFEKINRTVYSDSSESEQEITGKYNNIYQKERLGKE